MDCIHRLNYGRLIGGFPSEEMLDLNLFATVLSEKLDFYALAGIMGETGLLMDWRDGRTGWDGGGTGAGCRY